MVKKLRCDVDVSDWILAEDSGEYVEICVHSDALEGNVRVYLTPENAKKLCKQIKAALAEIEDEPEDDMTKEKEDPAYIPHVGEVVEVYRNTVAHQFGIGERVRIVYISNDGTIKAESLDGDNHWWVGNNIRPIQNWKPKEGEKVLIVDSTLVPTALTKSCIGGFGTFRLYDIDIDICIVDCGEVVCFNLSDLRPAE